MSVENQEKYNIETGKKASYFGKLTKDFYNWLNELEKQLITQEMEERIQKVIDEEAIQKSSNLKREKMSLAEFLNVDVKKMKENNKKRELEELKPISKAMEEKIKLKKTIEKRKKEYNLKIEKELEKGKRERREEYELKRNKILIDFDKMDEIGGEPVIKINNTIKYALKEKKRLVEITNNEIIKCVNGWGNIVMKNEADILKRNKEIIEYAIFGCSKIMLYNIDKRKIIRFKKFIEIRNQGKKDMCLRTDKQMIERYDIIEDIISERHTKFRKYVKQNINEDMFTKEQMEKWIDALIEINTSKKMLEIYDGDWVAYDYLLYSKEGKKFNVHQFFKNRIEDILDVFY